MRRIVIALMLTVSCAPPQRYERAFFIRHKLFIPFAMVNAVFILVASVAGALCLV